MERYYVKRPTGKVFGPFDENAIRLMLKGNKLGTEAQVSTDKESWKPISQVDAFADALGNTTRAGVSHEDLPGLRGSNLPRSAAPDLPQSKGSNLPRPAGSNLPRPKGSVPDLPVSKSSVPDLPVSKSAGPELPKPKSDGWGLPKAKAPDLPRSAQDNLPEPASQLPRSSADNLPSSAPPADDDLFGAPIEDDDDLFAAPANIDLEEDSDDLFASPAGLDEDSDDLFASPAGLDDDSDDLFASPLNEDDDDLFASPVQPQEDPLEEEDDDLFESGPMDDDDLFAAAPGDDDDFLGGDAGFSFLDEEGDDSNSGGLEDWEEELVGNDSYSPDDLSTDGDEWGDDLVDDAPAQPSRAPRKPQPASTGSDPFRPASTGIKRDEAPEQVTTGRDEVIETDKKRGLMTMIGVPILAVLIIGGAGFGIYSALQSDDDTGSEATAQGPQAIELSIDLIGSDNYIDLLQTIESAQDGTLDEINRGRLLLAQNLFLMRYEDDRILQAADDLASELIGLEDEPTIAVALAMNEARAAQTDSARAYAEPNTSDDGLRYFAHLAMGIADIQAHLEGQEIAPPAAPQEVADDQQDEDQNEEGLEEIADDQTDSEEDLEPAEPETTEPEEAFLVQRSTEQFQAAAQAAPETALPHYWLAIISLETDDRDGALEHLERGINAGPDHVASRLKAGLNYHERGALNDAAEHLRKIIDELSEFAHDDERATAFHLMGMVHMARQESEEAIDMFTRALNTDSSRVDSLRALAEEYERAEMYEEALNFFTTDQNLGQQDPEVMLGIVRSHMGLEEYASAIRKLQEGEEEFPEDARFPYYLGQLNERRGTFYEAREAFERAIEIDPDLLTAHAALAQLTWRIDNDIAQGEAHVREIVERPERIEAPIAASVAEFYRMASRPELARQWNQDALRRNPNYWEARLALSRLLLDEDNTEEALNLLETAREEGIRDIRLSAYLADAYRQDRQFDRAIDEINSVISEQSDNEKYIFIRGRIYYDQGNYATAREDFNNAYQLDTRFHEAYFYVGRTALAEHDYTTATRIFRHVLDYQPNNGKVHYYMGRTFEADDSLSQALESYRRATAVDPAFARENPAIYIRRGRLLTRMGYTRQGKRDIQQALEIDPNMSEALLAMGETNFTEQDYVAAIENYRRAIRDFPEDETAHFRLGMSYIYEHREQEAARHLQLAIRHGYDNPDIFRRLGYLYRDLGQRRQAVESFKTFLRESHDDLADSSRREILRQISDLGG